MCEYGGVGVRRVRVVRANRGMCMSLCAAYESVYMCFCMPLFSAYFCLLHAAVSAYFCLSNILKGDGSVHVAPFTSLLSLLDWRLPWPCWAPVEARMRGSIAPRRLPAARATA